MGQHALDMHPWPMDPLPALVWTHTVETLASDLCRQLHTYYFRSATSYVITGSQIMREPCRGRSSLVINHYSQAGPVILARSSSQLTMMCRPPHHIVSVSLVHRQLSEFCSDRSQNPISMLFILYTRNTAGG